jgi:hypothetical protein
MASLPLAELTKKGNREIPSHIITESEEISIDQYNIFAFIRRGKTAKTRE